MNNLFIKNLNLVKSILFADDTNLFYSNKSIAECCNVVSKELEVLNIIMVQDK